MKIYFLELFFDSQGKKIGLDSKFERKKYATETKTVKATGNDLESIKNDIKAQYSSLRYIHLVDIFEEL